MNHARVCIPHYVGTRLRSLDALSLQQICTVDPLGCQGRVIVASSFVLLLRFPSGSVFRPLAADPVAGALARDGGAVGDVVAGAAGARVRRVAAAAGAAALGGLAVERQAGDLRGRPARAGGAAVARRAGAARALAERLR